MSDDSSSAPVAQEHSTPTQQPSVRASAPVPPVQPPKAPQQTPGKSSKLPWGPVAAIVYAAFLYVAAQLIAALGLTWAVHTLGWSSARADHWLTYDTFAQFLYILLAETLTIGGIVWFVRRRGARLSQIGWNGFTIRYLWWALAGFGVYFVSYIAVAIAVSVLVPSIDMNQQQNIGFTDVAGATELILTFVSLVVLPPLAEELVFRGFVFGGLRARLTFWPATLVTSVLFAIPHLQFGDGAPLLWVAAIDTMVLSVVLCFVRERTGSLWPGILIHALKNGLAFTALFLIH